MRNRPHGTDIHLTRANSKSEWVDFSVFFALVGWVERQRSPYMDASHLHKVFLVDSDIQCRLQPYIRSLLQPSVRLLTHDEIRWPRAQLTLRTQSALGFTSCCGHGLTCGCHLFKKHSSNRLGVTPLLNHSKKRLVFTSSRSSGTGRG